MERDGPDPEGAAVRADEREGNHGEDVKEYYFYLDTTPTHSYMKYLYKYPQAAFPYEELVETNRSRDPRRAGVRAARHRGLRRRPLLRRVRRVRQGGRRRLLIRITVHQPRSRGGDAARAADAVVPQHLVVGRPDAGKPRAARAAGGAVDRRIASGRWATYRLYCDGAPELLFTENETNTQRLFGSPNARLT